MSKETAILYTVSDDEDGIRLDRWFKRHFPEVPNGMLQKALRKKDVRLGGARAEAATRVQAAQEIRLSRLLVAQIQTLARNEAVSNRKQAQNTQNTRLSEATIAETQAMVLHKDADVIALNKPSGLAVQGGSGLKDSIDHRMFALRFEKDENPKLTHRIDRDTSGLLLLARSAKAAASLTQGFKSKQIQKTYWALVMGVPEVREGEIELALEKASQGGKGGYEKMVAASSGKPAITHYRVIDVVGHRFAWVELMPITGRTHQLRVHMAEIGHPILGDGKYGGRDAYPTGMKLPNRLHLHAQRVQMEGGDGLKPLDVSAPLPEHMVTSFDLLGLDESNENQ